MSGIHKTLKKVIPKETVDPINKKVMDENIRTHESLNRRMNPKMPEVGDDTVIPLPDEEELERVRRRKNRGGGRASTVLTSDDEGLGG
jgi:hypothetical protein